MDLLEAQPPSKALLLTCRHVQSEARLMYVKAYRSFWCAARFVLKIDEQGASTEPAEQIITSMRENDIAHVKNLRIENDYYDRVWVYRNGIWDLWRVVSPTEMRMEHTELRFRKAEVPMLSLREFCFDLQNLSVAYWTAVALFDESPARIEVAKRISGKRGLRKDELLLALEE